MNKVDEKVKESRTYKQNGPKAVILFHAFTGTPIDVASVGRALERENYTVLMPTLDGHGEDDPDELFKYGIQDWVKTGNEAYKQLVNDGYTDISVFGLSLGGIVATDVMLNNDVQTYGTFSSPVVAGRGSKVPENFWMWYKFKKKKLGVDEATIEANKEEVMERLDTILSGINDHVRLMMKEYANVTLPVFIGQGGQDEMVDADIANTFREMLENAEVDFHWYEDAPHVITTGRAGKETQKDLLQFLEKHL